MISMLPSLLQSSAIPLPLAAIIGEWMSILNPIVIFFTFLGIFIGRTIAKGRKERMRHELIRCALEKGQPLPPELLEGKIDFPRRDDRRSGLIVLAIGFALFFFLQALHVSDPAVPDGVKWVGLIPGLIGAALLLNWALERGGASNQKRS